jgi:hypothetical protein
MGEWWYRSNIPGPGPRWCVVSFTLQPHHPRGKNSQYAQYPLDRRLGGLLEPVWRLWSRDKFLALLETEPWLCSPQPIAILTELFQLVG